MDFFANMRQKQLVRYLYSKNDIFVDSFRICPIHKMPSTLVEGSMLDFYVVAEGACYMLRVINDPSDTYTIQKENPINKDFTLLVVRKRISDNVKDEIKSIMEKIKDCEIPSKVSEDIVYKMEW